MTIKQQLVEDLRLRIKELGIEDIEPQVDYPADPANGDYSSNIALIAAKMLGKNPLELAEEIATDLRLKISIRQAQDKQDLGLIEKIEVAKPGFINFWISSDVLIKSLTDSGSSNSAGRQARMTSLTGKKVMVEFAHPNTHKAFHIGHLRNIITGESVVRLLEATGTYVIRANYQGDVGMHIARALYGLLHNSQFTIHNSQFTLEQKVEILGKAYSEGSKAYEEDPDAKKEIGEINKKIYARDETIWELYKTTRQWSLDYFDHIYKRLGSSFHRYFFESEVYESGKANVLKGLEKGIFEKSDGAIIFPGKKYGLHDRVFITSEGNPTYEGKEVGLGPLQFKEYNPDLIVHVVGPEQAGYFQVVFEALAQLFPETKGRERHLVYGWVKLKSGKMSSRSGNVILGEWLIDEAKKEIHTILDKSNSEYDEKKKEEIAERVGIGAVKYSFLKVSTQQEIAFDIEESVSFEGNSGPYIQYVYARTQSVIAKAQEHKSAKEEKEKSTISLLRSFALSLQPEERELLRLLAKFDEVVIDAAERLAPNILCTYLFEVSQAFNHFYQKCPILKAEGESRELRLVLTKKAGEVIKNGLNLLGIEAPAKM